MPKKSYKKQKSMLTLAKEINTIVKFHLNFSDLLRAQYLLFWFSLCHMNICRVKVKLEVGCLTSNSL